MQSKNLHFNKFLKGECFTASSHWSSGWSFMETTALGNESSFSLIREWWYVYAHMQGAVVVINQSSLDTVVFDEVLTEGTR